MTNLDRSKKPARQDWHKAEIKAALEMRRGLSLAKLARLHGYARSSAVTALKMPWPKMERLIADAIGVEPQVIWPSRYRADGTPKSNRGERGLGRYKAKHSTGTAANDVQSRKAA